MKSDIFFFITSVAVVFLSILVAMILVYGFKVIKDLRFLTQKIREEGEEVIKDFKEARVRFREKGSGLFSIMGTLFSRKRSSKSKKEHKEEHHHKE